MYHIPRSVVTLAITTVFFFFSTIQIESNLVELLRFNDGIGPGDLLPPHLLEVERAAVLLRVPVGPTERGPTPALEPGQPHALPAHQAAIRPRHHAVLIARRRHSLRQAQRRQLRTRRW